MARVGMISLRTIAPVFIVLQPGLSATHPVYVIADTKDGAVQKATGHFDIEMKPQTESADGITRSLVTKHFRGDVDGISEGEMLSVRTATPGSAGYVLVERVTVEIAGKSGSFMIFPIPERIVLSASRVD